MVDKEKFLDAAALAYIAQSGGGILPSNMEFRANLAYEVAEALWKSRRTQQYVHVKTGGIYSIICGAEAEASGEALVIYRGQDGRVWARPHNEFHDGRFKKIKGDE